MTLLREVRLISIRQPYVWAIFEGLKRVENRSRSTPFRGPVLIHAGQAFDYEAALYMQDELGLELPEAFPRGAIVGVCDLVDVIEDDPNLEHEDWFVEGKLGYVLERPTLLREPIPLKGKLGLWKADPQIVALANQRLPRGRHIR